MTDYRHELHNVYMIHLHSLWVTKNRKPTVGGEVGRRTTELVGQICPQQDVRVINGHMSRGHLHLLVSLTWRVAVSRLVQRLKGKTACKMLWPLRNLVPFFSFNW